MNRLLAFLFFMSLYSLAIGQEPSKRENFKNTATMGVGRANDISDEISVSNIGLDYLRKVSQRFELGVQLDLEWKKRFNGYKGTQIAGTIAYSIKPQWPVFAGPGIAFEGSHQEGFARFGTEYSFYFGKNSGLFLAPGFFADYKAHDGWALSIMVVLGMNW